MRLNLYKRTDGMIYFSLHANDAATNDPDFRSSALTNGGSGVASLSARESWCCTWELCVCVRALDFIYGMVAMETGWHK